MGCEFDYFEAASEAAVKSQFKKKTQNQCDIRGEGNTYCGCMCQKDRLEWTGEVFDSFNAASDYLSEDAYDQKHSRYARVVAYRRKLPLTEAAKARIDKAGQTFEAAIEARNVLRDKLRNDFAAAKSRFVKCKNPECESSIRRSKVCTDGKDPHCPVCDTTMLSPTSRDRLDAHEAKIKKLRQRLAETREKALRFDKKLCYVVGAWCSC